jgi:hypothetical protein
VRRSCALLTLWVALVAPSQVARAQADTATPVTPAPISPTASEPPAAPAPAAMPAPTPEPIDTGADLTETIDTGPAAAGASDSPDAESAEPDLVESIDGAPGPVAAAASRASPSAPDPDRFELRGWARLSTELGLGEAGPSEAARGPTAMSYDPLVLRNQLFARARYSHARWFEANLSGVLSYGIFERSPALASTTFTGFNGQSTRGELDTRLHELFLAFYFERVDLRIGQQRLAWGRADFISPNDVINARDARDPFLSEQELRATPTLLARADFDLGFGSLQAVFSPVFVPDRFDVYGSNWAALQPGAPAGLRGLVGLLDRSSDPSLQSTLQTLLQATGLPRADFTQPSAGAKFAWSAGGIDVSHYYHYGFDGPFLAIAPDLAMTLANTDFGRVGLADLQPFLRAIDDGRHPLQVTYVRRHHVGLDAGTTLGPVAVRLDAALQSTHVFFRRDLQGVKSPSLRGVLSVEYQTGEPDKALVLELLYQRVLSRMHAPLLFYDRDTLGVASILRWPLFRRFGGELRIVQGLQPVSTVLQPQLNAKFDALVLSLGSLWLQGARGSFGDYFRRNREVYLKAKYSF